MTTEKEIKSYVKNTRLGLETLLESIDNGNIGIAREKIKLMEKQASDMYENILLSSAIINEESVEEKWAWKMAWCGEQGLAPAVVSAWDMAETAYAKRYTNKGE